MIRKKRYVQSIAEISAEQEYADEVGGGSMSKHGDMRLILQNRRMFREKFDNKIRNIVVEITYEIPELGTPREE